LRALRIDSSSVLGFVQTPDLLIGLLVRFAAADLLAAQLKPTSVSSLRISETLCFARPVQAIFTRTGSDAAVQIVASQVKPTWTPFWLLCLYSLHTFWQLAFGGTCGR
jgi:hypothetical protein